MMCASWRWISTGADKPVIALSGLSGDPISREIPQGGEPPGNARFMRLGGNLFQEEDCIDRES